MIYFITDLNSGNLISLIHVAKALKLGDEELFELFSSRNDFMGTARLWQIQNVIIQIISADGWEIVEKFKRDGVWHIHTIPIICFGLFATGEIKPITNTEADFVTYNKLYWRHKSSPKILNPFRVFENEAEFLKGEAAMDDTVFVSG